MKDQPEERLINGVEYPRYSTIAGLLDKPALVPWAAGCAARWAAANPFDGGDIEAYTARATAEFRSVSQEAMSIGTEVHELVHAYTTTGQDPTTGRELRPEVTAAFCAFLELYHKLVKKTLHAEALVWSELHGYAGTLDAIVELHDGSVWLLDYKTSKAIYPEYSMQASAYSMAAVECGLVPKIDGLGIMRLDKETGIPEFKDVTKGHRRRCEAWGHLCRYYYAAANRRLKHNQHAMAAKELDK